MFTLEPNELRGWDVMLGAVKVGTVSVKPGQRHFAQMRVEMHPEQLELYARKVLRLRKATDLTIPILPESFMAVDAELAGDIKASKSFTEKKVLETINGLASGELKLPKGE